MSPFWFELERCAPGRFFPGMLLAMGVPHNLNETLSKLRRARGGISCPVETIQAPAARQFLPRVGKVCRIAGKICLVEAGGAYAMLPGSKASGDRHPAIKTAQ